MADSWQFEEFQLSLKDRSLRRAGEPITVPPKAFDLLAILVQRAGVILTKQELLDLVWQDTFVEESNLTYTISILRKALDDSAEQPRMIETIPKHGYRFRAQVRPDGIDDVPALTSALHRPALRWAALVCGLLGLGTAVWWITHPRLQPVKLRQNEFILVGEFENLSHDPDLDGTIETALEAELSTGANLRIISPDRVADAMKLMHKPAVTRVNAALIREVCFRDPAIRVAVTGSVQRVGNEYLLTAKLLQASDASILAAVSYTAVNKPSILRETGRLARWVQQKLGDRIPDHYTYGDPAVTTTSLEALKLYSDAVAAFKADRSDVEVLTRRALEIDPDFASAEMLLAWCLRNRMPGTPQLFMPVAKRALAKSSQISDRESLFLQASYFSMTGDEEKAIPVYEAMVRRYPGAPFVVNNLLQTYLRTQRFAQAIVLRRDLPNLRPNDPEAYLQAADSCFCGEPCLAKVKSLAQRGCNLGIQQAPEVASLFSAKRLFFFAGADWVSGDIRGAQRDLDEMRIAASGSDLLSAMAAIGFLTLGQLGEAEKVLATVNNDFIRHRWLIWRYLLANDLPNAKKIAAQMKNDRANGMSIIGLIRAGEFDTASAIMQRPLDPKLAGIGETVEAEWALAHDRRVPEVARLEAGFAALAGAAVAERWIAVQDAAKAYVARGDYDGALKVLKETESPTKACNFTASVTWPLARFEALNLYRKLNQIDRAAEVEKQLREMLVYADPEYLKALGMK